MGWKQTAAAADKAMDARDEAVAQYGEDSPEALVADEIAWSALRAHENSSEG